MHKKFYVTTLKKTTLPPKKTKWKTQTKTHKGPVHNNATFVIKFQILQLILSFPIYFKK